MALETSKQIAFRGGTRGGGDFQYKDVGQSTSLARLRQQQGIIQNYKDVAAKADRDARDHLSDLQRNQIAERNNRQNIHDFEIAALNTAANATANVAKQWSDYGDEEVAQIERDALSVMGLSQSAGKLFGAAGEVIADRIKKNEEIDTSNKETSSIHELSADSSQEAKNFASTFDKLLREGEWAKTIRRGTPINDDGNNDNTAQEYKDLKNSWQFQLIQKEISLNRGIHDIDQTLQAVKNQLEKEAKGAYTQKELNDIAYILTSEIHGLRGRNTAAALKAKKYLRDLEKKDENFQLIRQNNIQAQGIFDERVTGGIQTANTVEDLNHIVAITSHPDSVLRDQGNKLTTQQVSEHVVITLVEQGNLELAQDFINAIPMRDGKPMPGGKDNGYLYNLGEVYDKTLAAGRNHLNEKQARANHLEGEQKLSGVLQSYDAQEGDPNFEGSLGQALQRYAIGDEQGFIDMANDALNDLKAYPIQHAKLSKRLWVETRGDRNWATNDELLELAATGDNWTPSDLMLFWEGTAAQKKAVEEKVLGLIDLRGFWDWDKRYQEIRGYYLIQMKRQGLTGPGSHPTGLHSVVIKDLVREYNFIKDARANGADRSGAVANGIGNMDAIRKDGVMNPNSYQYILHSQDSANEYATFGNATKDARDGHMATDKVLNLLFKNIEVDEGEFGTNTHGGDIRSVLRNWRKHNTELSGLFWKGDLYQQASTMMRGGVVRLTEPQKRVFKQLKLRVPNYTETQFIEDVLIGHGYPIQEGNMSVKDFYAVGSPGQNTDQYVKLIQDSNTTAEVKRLSVYSSAINNDLSPATRNLAASYVIDYKNSIPRDTLNQSYGGEVSEELVDTFSRMQGTLGEVDFGNFDTEKILEMEPIHGYHYLRNTVIPVPGTEEEKYCQENMNGYFSWDWRNEKALANKTCLYKEQIP